MHASAARHSYAISHCSAHIHSRTFSDVDPRADTYCDTPADIHGNRLRDAGACSYYCAHGDGDSDPHADAYFHTHGDIQSSSYVDSNASTANVHPHARPGDVYA
jgi:hypothetical protein